MKNKLQLIGQMYNRIGDSSNLLTVQRRVSSESFHLLTKNYRKMNYKNLSEALNEK